MIRTHHLTLAQNKNEHPGTGRNDVQSGFGYQRNLKFDTSKPYGVSLKKVVTSKMDRFGWKDRPP